MINEALVKIGTYRNQTIENVSFELIKGLHQGVKGLYITVKNDGQVNIDIPKIKIKLNSKDDVVITTNGIEHKNTPKLKEETDDEAMNRIATRFDILEEMSAACAKGDIRGIIVSGPPGVGKSYGVERQMEKASLFDNIAGRKVRFEIVKGAMTPVGLYAKLYEYSDPKSVLVFDDCDSVFMDDLSLNLIKAALDSSKKRKICWNSDSYLLRREKIPDSFEFKGSAIFITNLKFSNIRSKKLQDHLDALQSRCHFIDLTIDTERDKMLRIKQVHRDVRNGLFADYGFASNESEQIFNYMEENKSRLREISMRMALKIADLLKISPNNWKVLAESTVLTRV